MVTPFTDAELAAAFPEFQLDSPPLGIGTFKVAYRGRSAEEEFVLKVLIEPLPDVDEEGEDVMPERFARELAAMVELGSPRIAQIWRQPEVRIVGPGRHLWYAEHFYPGGTLEKVLEGGPVGFSAAVDIGLDLLEGVSSLWEANGIVHRDIKPGNIAFDESGHAVLLDLGIAYFSALDSLTDSFALSPRTPIYAAPEQFEMRRNARIDFRTDLFQIGIVLFECLTGEHPFWRRGIAGDEYFKRLMSFDPATLVAKGVEERASLVIARLLAATPSRRFRSIASAVDALAGVR
ncbi:MAG TPA: serine/threonine-protein kinase [Thermoleophilia bacterium]